MLRKSAAILALFLTCFAPHVVALGLGAVSVESALNQPLMVRIEVLQLGDTRLDDVRISVATPEDFVRFGIERSTFLNNIRFQTESSVRGDFVVLTTNQIVREPYLSFILETRWSNGRLLSEHTILLDLPVFQEPESTIPAPVRAPISTVLTPPAPANRPAAPQQQSQSQPSEPSQSVQPILEPEVIASPAESNEQASAQAPEVVEEPAAQTVEPSRQPEPLAQTSEETSSEEDENQVETIQAEEEILEEVAEESELEAAEPEIVEEPAPEPELEQTITSSDSETLTDIALRVRPNQNVSVQQTMLAIQELNPDAFIGGNINRLRSGQVLRVPSLANIEAIDPRQAIDEVARQNRQIAQADVQPLAAPANTAPTQDSATGQLSVITGEPDSEEPGSSSSSSDLDRRIADLETQLALREEEADRARLEREEMESRLADLDEQIAAAQEIIRLQDLQLAQLQQSLADAAAEAELAAQQAAAAAAQVVVPPVSIRQPSLLDTLLSNSMLLIGGAGVLVLGLVMFMLRRNKSNNRTDVELDEIDEEEFNGVTEKQDQADSREAGGSEFQDYNEADLDSELDDIISVGSNADKKAPEKDPEVLLDSANEDDICAQAEILLDQDNIKQAENLLRAAIEENPDSEKLSLKLLAVLAKKGDLSEFEVLADELHGLSNPAIDKEVDALRSTFSSQTTKTSSFTGKSSQQERDDTASFLDDLGIDLDSFDDDTFELADDPVPASKPSSKPSVSLDDLPDDPEPEDMDLTFDFADDPVTDEVEDKLGSPEIDELEASDQAENGPEAVAEQTDEELETFSFDEDVESADAPALAAGASKDVADLEIDSLDFDSSIDLVEKEKPSPQAAEEMDLETFAFDAPTPPSANQEIQEEPEIEIADENILDFDFDKSDIPSASDTADVEEKLNIDVADENALDFDFDKSEIEAAPTETDAEDELETFDFDLKAPGADTIIEKSDEEEISFDLDDEDALAEPISEVGSEEATIVETRSSSKEFDFDLSELEIDANEVEEDIEISLSDDDFLDLGDDEESVELSTEPDDENDIIDFDFDFDAELPASKTTAADTDSSEDDDDLNFLSDDDDDEIDISSISIDDDDDDTYAMSDEDETATKLELAYAYQKMGDAEGAKEILLEVIKEGTESQIKEAQELIKVVESSSGE